MVGEDVSVSLRSILSVEIARPIACRRRTGPGVEDHRDVLATVGLGHEAAPALRLQIVRAHERLLADETYSVLDLVHLPAHLQTELLGGTACRAPEDTGIGRK